MDLRTSRYPWGYIRRRLDFFEGRIRKEEGLRANL